MKPLFLPWYLRCPLMLVQLLFLPLFFVFDFIVEWRERGLAITWQLTLEWFRESPRNFWECWVGRRGL